MADEKNITMNQLGEFAARVDARLDNAEANIIIAQSTAKTAQNTADAALPKSGGTMTGAVVAQNNTDYATKQMRNISLIADGSSMPSGSDGDVCLVYKP